MPTKTATAPKTKLRDTEGELMKLVEDGVAILEAAWLEERPLSYDERLFFQRQWVLSEYEVDRVLRRYDHVRRQQEISGTAADRAALAKAAEDAAALVETKGPEIRAEIESLQKRLNQMERERDSARKRVEETDQAVRQLRSSAPSPIKRLHDGKQQHLVQTLEAPTNGMKSDIRHLEVMLAMDPADPKTAEHFKFHEDTRGFVIKTVDSRRQIHYALNQVAYQEWRADAEVELEEMRKELPRLEAEYEAARVECAKLLDFWVR